MATLSQQTKRGEKKPRLRFKIFFPDGGSATRDRLYDSKAVGRHKKQVAEILEATTAQRRQTENDIAIWRAEGLLSPEDSKRLGAGVVADKTLASAAEDYLMASTDLSDRELYTRKGRVRRIVEILGARTLIVTLRHRDGLAMRQKLTAAGLARATINKYIQDARRMLDLQLDNETIPDNPMARVKPLRGDPSEAFQPTAISSADVGKLLDAASQNDLRRGEQDATGAKCYLGGNLHLFLLLYFGCGLRRTEATKLTWEMVQWDRRTIEIPGTITKNKKPRVVGVGLKLIAELAKRRQAQGYILPKYHPDTITHHISAFFTEHGFPTLRLHDTRHTFATLLQEQTGATAKDTQHRLGHSNAAMTEHYTHARQDKGPIEIFEDRLEFMDVEKGEGEST